MSRVCGNDRDSGFRVSGFVVIGGQRLFITVIRTCRIIVIVFIISSNSISVTIIIEQKGIKDRRKTPITRVGRHQKPGMSASLESQGCT